MVNHLNKFPDYCLATADILYGMPDHPSILQTFIWQQYDIAPDFPALMRFLDFWEHNLEGKLHSVRIAHIELINPREIKYYPTEFKFH